MQLNAYGKITLSLKVIGKRSDGYHEVEQIMAPILLCDTLEIRKTDKDIAFDCNIPELITNDNLCYLAAKKMLDMFQISSGLEITLHKRIPIKAGLGGGSADGAAVLRAINYLYDLNLSREDLIKIGIQLGADVPFCLCSELSFISGIGERIKPIDTPLDYYVLIIKPKEGISTKLCFDVLDANWAVKRSRYLNNEMKPDINENLVNLQLCNDLEAPAISILSEISNIKMQLKSIGFDHVMMSGSGSCVIGISNNINLIQYGEKLMKSKYPFVAITSAVKRISDIDSKYAELLQYEEKAHLCI